MVNWKDMTTLEIVEALAAWEDMIDSEEALSEKFDKEEANCVGEQYGIDDTIAMSEAFSNWADALCAEGELCAAQYEEYSYVGKYSA